MANKKIIINFIKLGISTWLKTNCKKINIKNIDIAVNNNFKGKIDELYLEATNLIYRNFYLNRIVITFSDFNLEFIYKKNLRHSDQFIKCLCEIDKINLKNILFTDKFKSLRIQIQEYATEALYIDNLKIKNGLINFFYKKNNIILKSSFVLKLEKNLIFLENIINKKKMIIPMDRNIRFNSCEIEDEVIHIDFLSKVIFNN